MPPTKYREPPLPFRYARRGETGTPFIEYLDQRVGRDRRARGRQLAFIHEWDYLTDEIQRPPTAKDYAERWNAPLSTVYGLLEEFRELFPTEADPGRVVQEIWNGVEAQQDGVGTFVDMDRVHVIATDQSDQPIRE